MVYSPFLITKWAPAFVTGCWRCHMLIWFHKRVSLSSTSNTDASIPHTDSPGSTASSCLALRSYQNFWAERSSQTSACKACHLLTTANDATSIDPLLWATDDYTILDPCLGACGRELTAGFFEPANPTSRVVFALDLLWRTQPCVWLISPLWSRTHHAPLQTSALAKPPFSLRLWVLRV